MRALLSLLVAAGCSGALTDPEPATGDAAQDPAEMVPACEPDRCAGCATPGAGGDLVEASSIPQRAAPTTVTPEPPLIRRSVRIAGAAGQFLTPSVPAHRTSFDGRIALIRNDAEVDGGVPGGAQVLTTLRLERLQGGPLVARDPQIGARMFGNHRVSVSDTVHPSLPASAKRTASFLCSPTTDQPTACGGDDCYDLRLIQEVVLHPGELGVVLESIPVQVRVKNPKTADAEIESVTVAPTSAWLVSQPAPFAELAEIVSSADGRLLAGRVLEDGVGAVIDYRRDDGSPHTAKFSLFYSHASAACDVRDWLRQEAGVFTSLRPPPAAYFDRRLRDDAGRPTYGLAAYPMRDAFGSPLGEDAILTGSYPWMDREGNNLVFSTVDPRAAETAPDGAVFTRYPMGRPDDGSMQPIGPPPRGFAVVGSWTQGKTVMLDSFINNEDFGFNANDTHLVQLYAAGGTPIAVKVNGGGKLGVSALGIPDARSNGHHMESLENLTTHLRGSLPRTARDVVWNLTRGLASDEIVFDDFLDPHLLLFAEMNAAWVSDGGPRAGKYLDGFVRRSDHFAHDPSAIRLQNAAASALGPLLEPGTVVGDARIEPVLLGGVHGRGLWLEPTSGMRFAIPHGIAGAFYLGLFVDARDDLAGERRLVGLGPEGEAAEVAITLRDGGILAIRHGDNSAGIDLSCAIGSWAGAWHHLGFLFEPDGRVTLFIDGNPAGSAALAEPIELEAGSLRIGADGGDDGVRGWYDEVRVVVDGEAGQLTRTASVELLCNDARGTMVAVGADSPVRAAAEVSPAVQERASALGVSLADGELAFCASDYTADYAIGRDRLPSGTRWLREEILLEGGPPLAADQPRPDSRDSSFCGSCHIDAALDPDRPPTLTLDALTAGDVDAPMDPRTQPMQPPSRGGPAYLRGVIPAGLVHRDDGTTMPAAATVGPVPVLDWLLD